MTDIDRSDEVREMYAEENDDPLAGMFNGAWLDTQEFPDLEYAVDGILPEGLGILVGPPKLGKSWWVADIGLAVACGGKALGAIPVAKRPVMYMALEDGPRRLQSRSRRIMRGQPLPAGIHFITKARPNVLLPMIGEFLVRYGDQKPLIILDTLGKARPPRPPGSDMYAWDYAVGTQLKNAIDSSPGAALLVVHHSRKAESADFVDSVSGSAGIAGSADFVLLLSRKRHSDEGVLSVTGRDVPESEYALDVKDGLWQLTGGNLGAAASEAESRRDKTNLGDRSLEVLAYVNQHEQTRAGDLESIGIHPDHARVYLNRLADKDKILKVARGLYKPVTTVTSVTTTDENQHNVTDITNVTPLFRGDTEKSVCGCGAPLVMEESIKSGLCMECDMAGGSER